MRPRDRALWLTIAALVFAYYFLRVWNLQRDDFIAYHNAASRALRGASPYRLEETPFKYLPIVSWLLAPLGLLPYFAAKLAFFVINFAAGADLYRRVIRDHGQGIALILLVSFARFHNYDFINVQVNHLLLWLFVFYLDRRAEQRWLPAAAGATLASFKIMPLLLAVPLLALGRIREVGRLATVFLGLILAPALLFDSGLGVYAEWFELMRKTTPYPAPASPLFQSVQSALWSALQGRWSAPSFVVLATLLQLALLAALAAAAWSSRLGGERREKAVLAAGMALSVVISPLAWKHNYLLLWPGVLLLALDGRRRVVIAQFALMTVLPALLRIAPRAIARYDYCTLAGALLIFFALLSFRAGVRGITKARRASSGTADPTP